MKSVINPTTLSIYFLLICFALVEKTAAQFATSPKREFRGVWVATVGNIDFPKYPTEQGIAHREQWRSLLEKYRQMGLNAVIVQVRPAGDAIYPSSIVPWSKFLTGLQDQGPNPAYDPLQFMVEEAHKMGFEFHAWFNPYRATTDLDTATLASRHVFNQHRKWVYQYGTRFYLNPAIDSVRTHISDVVAEVVQNYDIDAVHFDDYFYPYKIPNLPLPDSIEFDSLGKSFASIEDWRRENVDLLMEEVSARIKSIKPFVQFGVSPFGVWRNKDKDPRGSDTRAGVTSYDDTYADVLKWMRMEWVDYVAPQLYWSIGYAPADHAKLINWWSANVNGKRLYIGHAAYKVAANQDSTWMDPRELPRQIDLTRRNWVSKGSAFFSSRSLLANPLGVRDSLIRVYKYPALIPTDEASEGPKPGAPKLSSIWPNKNKVRLKWKANKSEQEIQYYVVYRFPANRTPDFDNGENILTRTAFGEKKKKYIFEDTSILYGDAFGYAVSAIGKGHVEGTPSRLRKILVTEKGVRSLRE